MMFAALLERRVNVKVKTNQAAVHVAVFFFVILFFIRWHIKLSYIGFIVV